MLSLATTWPPSAGTRQPRSHGTLLSFLTPQDRAELLALGTRREYQDGETVLCEGDSSTHVCLLIQGFAKVTASLENGRVALLGIRIGGDLVGEMSAIDGQPRSATVTACGKLVLRTIPRGAFIALLERRRKVDMAVMRMMSRRLRFANRRRVDFNGYSCGVRLARILVEIGVDYGRPSPDGLVLDLGLTQHDLGALAGAEVDTVSKELGRLRSQGLIGTGYRRTVIRDLNALREFAHLAD